MRIPNPNIKRPRISKQIHNFLLVMPILVKNSIIRHITANTPPMPVDIIPSTESEPVPGPGPGPGFGPGGPGFGQT